MAEYYLAIDIGASSGRHILGHLEDGRLVLEELYRFDNLQVYKNGHDCWDSDNLWQGILDGLKVCKEQGKLPKTVGIDTWGVDFLLLDENDEVIGDAVAYRDGRTGGMDAQVEECVPLKELYQRTGIQKASYNTIYQLMALKKEHPEHLERAENLLFTPDYYHFKLTGKKTCEYTIASTSNLLNARTMDWDEEIINALGFPGKIFGTLSMPGTVVGEFSEEIAKEVGFSATVVLPASHDTGSAFLAIPALDENAVYISSGTWSLLGVENESPITSAESFEQNFTNEGGAWGRYRFLKNIMGLWMIQSIRRELNGVSYIQGKEKRMAAGRKWSFPDLIEEAKKAEGFTSVVDVDRDCFLAPESMTEAIKEECRRTGQKAPESVGELMQCVYQSLARCYRDAISNLERLTGKRYTSINIVGGGCQDGYLNLLTAQMTGLPVYAGPIEGTAIGNLIVQMVQAGEFENLQSARDIVRESFEITRV
ncbi:MAG: rhamnulokinase [Lachnospiraceae bacterium]|nr:rhamnulokinase [Lachnospiraceae bacterium]